MTARRIMSFKSFTFSSGVSDSHGDFASILEPTTREA
jgi:hypothetical protein